MHAGDSVLVYQERFIVQSRKTLARPALDPTAVAIGVALAPSASTVRASPVDLTTCDTSALSQPFPPRGDLASYELAPAGDFETPAWTLSDGAQRVRESEPYAASGRLGSWSVALPAGSSAQSPTTCVDAAYPTIRFFIAGTGSVAVTMVDGALNIPAGIAVAGPRWLPTTVMITASPILGALSNGVAQVSLRLTGLGGNPVVDDVFIDPSNRR
jgi:hypothetical protein